MKFPMASLGKSKMSLDFMCVGGVVVLGVGQVSSEGGWVASEHRTSYFAPLPVVPASASLPAWSKGTKVANGVPLVKEAASGTSLLVLWNRSVAGSMPGGNVRLLLGGPITSFSTCWPAVLLKVVEAVVSVVPFVGAGVVCTCVGDPPTALNPLYGLFQTQCSVLA